MADKSAITDRLIVQTKAMFRLAAVKGFSQELIHSETGLPTTSLSDWANGKAKMSLVGMLAIAEIPDFPLELLSLIMPANITLVRVPEGVDHDDLAECFHDYLQAKERAHHPESEAGREIGPGEHNVLCLKAARVKAAA
jgi:hypothetical protein